MTNETPTLDARINLRMTDLLFQNVDMSQGIVLINGLAVFLILYRYMPVRSLTVWLITLLVITLLRLTLARLYWKRRQQSKPVHKLTTKFFIATYLSAMTWGVLILMVPVNVVWMEAFIAFVMAGISAGSLITGSARLGLSVPYLVLILSSLPYHYAGNGDPPHLAMALMVTLYMFLLIRLAFRIHDMQYASIKSDLENTDMFQVLKRSKRETDDMRLRLQKEVENLPRDLARVDLFFELSPDLFAITDTDGIIHQANTALQEATGMEADEIENQSVFSLLHADDIHNLKEELKELMMDEDEIRCQLRLKYADGNYRPVDFHIIFNNGYFYLAGREAPDAPL